MKRISIFFLYLSLNIFAAEPTLAAASAFAGRWDEIAVHINDRQYTDAVEVTEGILAEARLADDNEHWARALIERSRLQTAMGQPENSVRNLQADSWPSDPIWRGVVELYYARSLLDYQRRFSHEIRSRELVVETGPVDLKAWTSAQFSREINEAFERVWTSREGWGSESNGAWALFMEQNNYPARIRGTLRDAVSYLWVEHLANSRAWLPGQQADTRKLNLDRLLTGDLPAEANPDLADPHLHPAHKISFILNDLRDWHQDHGRREAALEAELENVARMRAAFTHKPDRLRIRQYLETQLADFDADYPWWAKGQWQLARLLKDEGEPDSIIRAHLAAERGENRHGSRLGGKLCGDLRHSLEQPQFDLRAMSHDSAGERSLQITHTNLRTLYFQAWKFDPTEQFRFRRGPRLRPDDIESHVSEKTPDLKWTVPLPQVQDYKSHATYTGLPPCAPGAYLVVASPRPDFDPDNGQMAAVHIIISDLVLSTQMLDRELEIMARSARTGQPVSQVKLTILGRHRQWQEGYKKSVQLRTDSTGRARMAIDDYRSFAIFGEKGKDQAWLNRGNFNSHRDPGAVYSSFIYTDRAIYRPGQTVHWKVVAYKGNDDRTEFKTRGEARVITRLTDANDRTAAADTLRTNEFGSASGSFVIPESGLLGRWIVRDSFGGQTAIRVEQYKRPTFEVSLLDPAKPLQLNQAATVTGQATYLFGLPVTSGQVRWRVTRSVSSGGSRWNRPPPGDQILATGNAELDSQGRFDLSFTTAVDPRLAEEEGVLYRYRVEADVTDDGGETRPCLRVFNLGFVLVRAILRSDTGFLADGQTAQLTAKRTDLNNVPQPGPGRWFLYELQQPEQTLLPAELPRDPLHRELRVAYTPGDELLPRWQNGANLEAQLAGWATGRQVAQGGLEHGVNGKAEVVLQDLPQGAYRILYITEDSLGGSSEAQLDFLAAGSNPLELRLPLVLKAEVPTVSVGGIARFLVHSGLPDQQLYLQVFTGGKRTHTEFIRTGHGPAVVEIPVTEIARLGLKVSLTTVRDHQFLRLSESIHVPWDNMKLDVQFATFRNRLAPGTKESFTVRIKSTDGSPINKTTTELLAYMYDRSLDAFATQRLPRPQTMFASSRWTAEPNASLGHRGTDWRIHTNRPARRPPLPLWPDRLLMQPGAAITMRAGELFVRGGRSGDVTLSLDQNVVKMLAEEGTPLLQAFDVEGAEYMVEVKSAISATPLGQEAFEKYAIDSVEDALRLRAGASAMRASVGKPDQESEQIQIRESFKETAFFLPHVQIGDDGVATVEYQVPDSVTDWNIWVHALTRDLHSGSHRGQASSVKDLMVRPYLPRFLREGDRAHLKVVINNAGSEAFAGHLDLNFLDPESGRDLNEEFGLIKGQREFQVGPGASITLSFALQTPARVGAVHVKAVARAGQLSDGEQRLLPILPGRMHLVQSRFVALSDESRRQMHFPLMASDNDATRVQGQLIVTIDAQLFGSVLGALPYLIDYPYECTEQTLNRYLSSSIVAGIFESHPSVRAMAQELAGRKTPLEVWNPADPNRLLMLEETPWLQTARGGQSEYPLLNLLDPKLARSQRESALKKLRVLQNEDGGFPWFPGGQSSHHLTLYILQGMARGTEFGVAAPQAVTTRAWKYLHSHFESDAAALRPGQNANLHRSTLLNYLMSCYPTEDWQAAGFTAEDRRQMLDLSYRHWRDLSTMLNGYLSLTLARSDRLDDARKVFAAVMDGAKEDPDLGLYWAPEDRAWLWYNDRVESHAFILRVLTELDPKDKRRQGLVHWLLLNKKLGHWKSTRATAEVIYALVHFMQQEGTLDAREIIGVHIGAQDERLIFEPEKYTGRNNQIIVAGADIIPEEMATVVVKKDTPGLAFASATWHFSTEELPDQADGDLFAVTRRYFLRHHDGDQWTLEPLNKGDAVAVGDQLEVHLSLKAKQAAEYVHLRDPRGAGFEPEEARSGYRWQNGLGYYEEFRDSGVNYFFTSLPTGQYTLKYRLRANMSGDFKVGPATVQSMYAPEFAAHSAGRKVQITP